MSFIAEPLLPGPIFDSAKRFANDAQGHAEQASRDPITSMGWTATLIPESDGGVGGSIADLIAIIDGLSQHGIKHQIIERCVLVPSLLSAITDTGSRSAWLGQIASGDIVVSPLLNTQPDLGRQAITAKKQGDSFILSGTVKGTAFTPQATHYLILAKQDNNIKDESPEQGHHSLLFLISAQALAPTLAASTTKRFVSIDGMATQDVSLSNLSIPASLCLACSNELDQAIQTSIQSALLCVGADSVGALGALIEHTIAYLKNRIQFAVPLASFQVLRHRTVDMYIRYESLRGMLHECLRQLATQDASATRSLQLMKLCVGEDTRFCAQAAIQLHGGMGITEEMLAARLAQRLINNEYRYGDRLYHSTTLQQTRASL